MCGALLLGAGIPALRTVDGRSALFVLLFGGLLGATAVLVGRPAISMSHDAISGRVTPVAGLVTKETHRVTQGRGGQSTDYFLGFPGRSRPFAEAGALYQVVTADQAYRVYYAPRSQVIVGMAPLKKAGTDRCQ